MDISTSRSLIVFRGIHAMPEDLARILAPIGGHEVGLFWSVWTQTCRYWHVVLRRSVISQAWHHTNKPDFTGLFNLKEISAMSSSAISAAHRRFHQRRGVAAVEFAVTAPILFLVVLGLIDVGRGVMVQQLLVNAARDGARSAVLDGATVTSVQTQVGDYLAASTVPGATVTVDPNPLTLAGIGDPVTVTVQIPFDSVSWLPPSIYLQGVTLQASVVMRSETVTAAP